MPGDLSSFLRPQSRVIDVGVTDVDAAREFTDLGHRYLGLVPPSRLADVRDHAGELAGRLHRLASTTQVVRNNADVLVLRAPFATFLWNASDLRHTRHVLVETPPKARAADLVLAATTNLASRIKFHGRRRFGDSTFLTFELTKRRPLGPRHYLSEVIGVPGLIRTLDEAGVSYCVLRWFETLPDVLPGEDLDMLVADDDLETVRQVLASEPGTLTVDMYSVTGLPGADFAGVAYYPPDVAAKILAGTVKHASGCSVPSPENHLHSLAYHALYHKGYSSGLPSEQRAEPIVDAEHDYTAALRDLAQDVGVSFPSTLEAVDEHLAEVGWRPSDDALRRLSLHNSWLLDQFRNPPDEPAGVPEPATFLIRERALDVLTTDEVLATLERLGFEVVMVSELDDDARDRCLRQSRGGNWDRGPFPVSGGPPVVAIVAAHYGPRTPPPDIAARYPGLSNFDTLSAKLRVRELIEARLPEHERFNPLHSSDNAAEAWEYVELAMPSRATSLREALSQRRDAYRTEAPVVATLSIGRRAKVEVVDRSHGRVVRKTFAPPFRRHLERELRAMHELGPRSPSVAELVDSGDCWLEQPYYDNQLTRNGSGSRSRLIPLRTVRQMVGVLEELNAMGVDLIDLKPGNFILDPRHGLKIVDFEFLYRYESAPPPLAQSYGFVGPPSDFTGDLPVSRFSYRHLWMPSTGMPLPQLINGSPGSQHLWRVAYRAYTALKGPLRTLRASRTSGGAALRRGRRQAISWGGRRAEETFERNI